MMLFAGCTSIKIEPVYSAIICWKMLTIFILNKIITTINTFQIQMFCTYITEDVREHTELELEYFDNVKSCRYKEYILYWFLNY
jgi:hypothetical protein